MFKELKEKLENGDFNYRPELFEIGNIPISPSTIYIYMNNEKFIVGTTTPRSFPSGEKEYLKQEEAEKEFFVRLEADKRAFHAYKKRGIDYPESPV